MDASIRGWSALRFVDPTTGGDVMPTMRCEMYRLGPASVVNLGRRTGSSIWVVHRGSGTSTIGDMVFEWVKGDCFVVPSWAEVEHRSGPGADLFTVSDAPVLEALGLARFEA
jgi:gentisate 1,2-dioxygenase